MNYRKIRIRVANKNKKSFDVAWPQTVSSNIIRDDTKGILEQSLVQYDAHLNNSLIHANRALSRGTASALIAYCPGALLVDNFPLLLELHTDLGMEPTLSVNGSEPAPIVTSDGSNIAGGQRAGSTLFLIWNARMGCWYIMNNDQNNSMTKVMIPSTSDYIFTAPEDGTNTIPIPGYNASTDAIVINYNQTILRLGSDFEPITDVGVQLLSFTLDRGEQLVCTITKYAEVIKSGSYTYSIVDTTQTFTAPEDNTTEIPLPSFYAETYSLTVNYNQTILRNGLDYTLDGNKKIVLNFPLQKDEQIVFTVLRYIERNGVVTAGGDSAKGAYRYSISVLHEEFEASYDHINVVAVPNFNRYRDDLTVIFKNHMLVQDVDYAIDELNQIVLMTMELMTGETIYFTILQGAMRDVPKFNISEAWGDGQNLKVDISNEEIHDFYTLLIRLNCELKDHPTLKPIDGPAEPIVDSNGRAINGGAMAGSFLWLAFNKSRRVWYCIGGLGESSASLPLSGEANFPGQIYIPNEPVREFKETVVYHGLGHIPEHVRVNPCEPPEIIDGVVQDIGDIWAYADEENLYVGNTGSAKSKFHWEVSDVSMSETWGIVDELQKQVDDFEKDLGNLQNKVDDIESSPAKIEISRSYYTVPDDYTHGQKIYVPNFDQSVDHLTVNMMQTLLRENLDYTIHLDNSITLNVINLKPKTVIEFIVIKQKRTT